MKILANSVLINYEITGNLGGDVVALSHTLGCTVDMWEYQLDALERDYQVLRIDTRGHGGTSAPKGLYMMDDLVDDAVALLDVLKIDKVHWFGLSLGSMIGQGLALRHPERLLSLGLFGTMATIRDSGKQMWKSRLAVESLDSLVDRVMQLWFTEAYRTAGHPKFESTRAKYLENSLAGYQGCCHAIMHLHYLDDLHKINVPTQIIVGREDMATPVAESREIHQLIEGSELSIIPNAVHLVNIEQAEQFNTVMMSFLDSL